MMCEYCAECEIKFTDKGIRTGLQRVAVSHSRFPALLYCPNCCVAYDICGNPMKNGDNRVYFDRDYTRLENDVFQWGRIVTDKKDLTVIVNQIKNQVL